MDKREQIIEIATGLFAERGYENTPLSLICETAEVSKGLISHHFKSKDGLLRELFVRKIDAMIEKVAITVATEESLSPQQKLVAFLDMYFSHLANDKLFFQLMLNLFLQPKTREILEDLIAEKSLVTHQMIQGVFDQIDAQNARLLRYMFIAELDGVTLNYLYEDFPLAEIKTHLINKYSDINAADMEKK